MSTLMAFLSGKGGSGKTTLALSMADLLCRCGVKTLLVDCDLSTNGATYFYESQINERNRSHIGVVSSFSRILCGDVRVCNLIPLVVNPQLDFIPSVSEISSEWTSEAAVRATGDTEYRLNTFLDWAQFDGNYDVILFDCQAGYSEFLPMLLPKMDADLFVLEADSISASAMRSLHLKVGSFFGRARLYQVFNKATAEEFDIYSKIVGTFFTNIGTLLFDWKIRQAFSRSQIPDLENNSSDYGAALCEICKVIFLEQKIKKSLSHFADQLRYQAIEEKRNKIEKELYSSKEKSLLSEGISAMLEFLMVITTVLLLCIAVILICMGPTSWSYIVENVPVPVLYVITGGVASASIVSFLFRTRRVTREDRRKRVEYMRLLKEFNKELAELEEKLKDT